MRRITEVIAIVVLIGWQACQSFLITNVSQGCGYNPADMVFLLDSSGSVGSLDFAKEREFAALFSKAFDIRPSIVQVCIVTFGDTPHNEFNLNTYGNEHDLANASRNIPYRHGNTRTDLALKYVEANSFTSQSGDRQNVPDILIVITDGQSNHPALTLAETVQLHKRNIKVLAIGIGNGTDDVELGHIASDPKYVFHLSSFDALTTLQTELKKVVCKVSGTWGNWTMSTSTPCYMACGGTVGGPAIRTSFCIQPQGSAAKCPVDSRTCPPNKSCRVCKNNPSIPGICGIPGVCQDPVYRMECLATCGLCDSVLLPG